MKIEPMKPLTAASQVEERTELAAKYFKDGFTCSQAVYMAYADLFGLTTDQAAAIAGSLGGGVGRLREVCGAVTGMSLVCSLAIPMYLPESTPEGKANKKKNYELVQACAADFKAENGSIVCRELLGLSPMTPPQPTPEPRTEQYYKKRPCGELVRMAAEIVGRRLLQLNTKE